jgi:hypothetical protein
MGRFRKKPVVIEAEQYTGEPGKDPHGVCRSITCGAGHPSHPHVHTIHERDGHAESASLAPGDWILPEPKPGRFYPCKPDIFAATYEPVEDPAHG